MNCFRIVTAFQKIIVCLAILLLSSQCALAQQFIILKNRTNGKIKVITQGNKVAFYLKGKTTHTLHRGKIEVITDSGLWVNDRHIMIDSLSSIGLRGAGPAFITGIASTITGALLVTNISNGARYGLAQFIIGEALLGTGIIQIFLYGIRMLTYTQHDLIHKWEIQIIKPKATPDS
jgi:hypothetical protein